GTLASFLSSIARMGVVILIALFFQAVHGDTAVEASLKLLPLSIAAMIASVTSGFLQRRFSPRSLAMFGSSLSTAGLGTLLLVIGADAPALAIMAGLLVLGFGSGTFLPSNATVLLSELPSNRLGIMNAMRLMLQSVGIVVGTALSLSIITAPLPPAMHDHVFAGTLSHVSDAAVQRLVTGYRWALACLVGISALATLTCLWRGHLGEPGGDRRGHRGGGHADPAARRPVAGREGATRARCSRNTPTTVPRCGRRARNPGRRIPAAPLERRRRRTGRGPAEGNRRSAQGRCQRRTGHGHRSRPRPATPNTRPSPAGHGRRAVPGLSP